MQTVAQLPVPRNGFHPDILLPAGATPRPAALPEAPRAHEPQPGVVTEPVSCTKPRIRLMPMVREVVAEPVTVAMPLTASDARIVQLLAAWHEAGRARFEVAYPNLDYDTSAPKTAKNRHKYLCLDEGSSGAWMVDRVTHQIYRIKAYGVPHKQKCAGTLGTVTGTQLEQWRHW